MTTTDTKTRLSELVNTAPAEAAPLVAVAQPVAAPRQTVMSAPLPEAAAMPPMASTFSHSPDISEIVGALAKAQGAFTAIERTLTAKVFSKRTNTEFSYDYAPLDAVLDAIRPALSANQIAILQFPSAKRGAITVTTLLAHTSGQWFRNDLSVGGPEGGDPQEIGKGITYARRYSLEALVGVSPGHDDDGASVSQAMQNPRPPVRQGPVQMPQRQAPVSPPSAAAAPASPASTAPLPGSPVPAQAPAPAGQPPFAITVMAIEPRRSAKGTPFLLVQFSNGTVAAAFDAGVIDALRKAHEKGTRYADVVVTKKGNFTYVDELIPEVW